jgi:L-threonylcarbamoyladenylate synthase
VGGTNEVERIASVLRAGGTVLLPTDTVYGVAALPSVPGATDQLFALKDRHEAQPLAVLVADAAQARSLTGEPSAQVSRWIDELWPGPLTLVLPRADSARHLALGGHPGTIGVRCPDHALVREVAALVGPIATTSANRHGRPTPATAAEAAAELTAPVGLVIDGGPSGTVASTVVDASVEPWVVLREGALAVAALHDRDAG